MPHKWGLILTTDPSPGSPSSKDAPHPWIPDGVGLDTCKAEAVPRSLRPTQFRDIKRRISGTGRYIICIGNMYCIYIFIVFTVKINVFFYNIY